MAEWWWQRRENLKIVNKIVVYYTVEFERWKRWIEVGDHSVIPGKVLCGASVSHIVAAHSGYKWEVVCGRVAVAGESEIE